MSFMGCRMGFMGSPRRWLFRDGLLPEQLWVPYGALWDTMGCHMWCMSYMGCYMGFMGFPPPQVAVPGRAAAGAAVGGGLFPHGAVGAAAA